MIRRIGPEVPVEGGELQGQCAFEDIPQGPIARFPIHCPEAAWVPVNAVLHVEVSDLVSLDGSNTVVTVGCGWFLPPTDGVDTVVIHTCIASPYRQIAN